MGSDKVTFSFDTINNFDRHIELSIPNYTHIYELIESMSSYFIKRDTNVYDLGCSTGLMIKNLSVANILSGVRFLGYEITDNMKPKSNVGFEWIKRDVTNEKLQFTNASLILSIFLLQFLSLDDRESLLRRAYNGLNREGALIVTEKIYIDNTFLNDVYTFSYYDYKLKTFSEQEILSKQRDLRYIMRPVTEKENMEMFARAGFEKIECFFASLMFKGWVLIK